MNPKKIVLLLCMYILLIINFSTSYFSPSNVDFNTFQADSETLVTGGILADAYGIETDAYGLVRLVDFRGSFASYVENQDNLASVRNNKIYIKKNMYTSEHVLVGNYISFTEECSKLEIVSIDEVIENDVTYYEIATNSGIEDKKNLSVIFYDVEGEEVPRACVVNYKSQYGLQGKVYRFLGKWLVQADKMDFTPLYFLTNSLLALVLVLIVYFISKKYNMLMAGCFYIVFLGSPWIAKYARNLYWVEWTWFLPVLIGLICTIYYKEKKVRFVCYGAMFGAILVKCLCGYEFITTIMLSSIAFLAAEFFLNIKNKRKDESILLFRVIVVMGMFALLGFVGAMVIHANIRGEGNIVDGLKDIVFNDALRRTYALDKSAYHEVYQPSLESSVFDVLNQYFHFNTPLIFGINVKEFGIFCAISFGVLFWDIYRKKSDVKDMMLCIVFFLASISWYVLAKAHSYIHTNMNYVMWYMGFVQMGIYLIVKKLYAIVSCIYKKRVGDV